MTPADWIRRTGAGLEWPAGTIEDLARRAPPSFNSPDGWAAWGSYAAPRVAELPKGPEVVRALASRAQGARAWTWGELAQEAIEDAGRELRQPGGVPWWVWAGGLAVLGGLLWSRR